jgi:NDP-sugar pyrophosphorylase family protein
MNKTSLRAGILAAGRGERLRATGMKPLIKIGGESLIKRVLQSIAEAGATEVVVIINEDSEAVRDHVETGKWPFALRWIVETTATSMHSFLRLVEMLSADGAEGPFLLSTVDTVAGPRVYSDFIAQARREKAAITLALTSPGDDEKPLLVRMAPGSSRIAAFGEGEYATAGIYAVRPIVLREADSARRDGTPALRAFLGRLLDRGYELAGIPISESFDVDRPADIEAAEAFLGRARE